MTYNVEISHVLQEWKERLDNSGNDFSYNIALSECIHDLENINNSIFNHGKRFKGRPSATGVVH